MHCVNHFLRDQLVLRNEDRDRQLTAKLDVFRALADVAQAAATDRARADAAALREGTTRPRSHAEADLARSAATTASSLPPTFSFDVEVGRIPEARQHIFQARQTRCRPPLQIGVVRGGDFLAVEAADRDTGHARPSRVKRTSNSNPSQPLARAYSKAARVFSAGRPSARAPTSAPRGRTPRWPSRSGRERAVSSFKFPVNSGEFVLNPTHESDCGSLETRNLKLN